MHLVFTLSTNICKFPLTHVHWPCESIIWEGDVHGGGEADVPVVSEGGLDAPPVVAPCGGDTGAAELIAGCEGCGGEALQDPTHVGIEVPHPPGQHAVTMSFRRTA